MVVSKKMCAMKITKYSSTDLRHFFLKLFIWLKQKVGQKSIKSIKPTPDYLLQTLQIYRLLEIIFQTITSGRCIGDQAGVASAVHDWRHQLETVRTTQAALFIRP